MIGRLVLADRENKDQLCGQPLYPNLRSSIPDRPVRPRLRRQRVDPRRHRRAREQPGKVHHRCAGAGTPGEFINHRDVSRDIIEVPFTGDLDQWRPLHAGRGRGTGGVQFRGRVNAFYVHHWHS